MSEYLVFYTESNLVCIIIFGIMLLHDLFNVDRQEKQIKYDRALITFMLYFVADTLCAAIIDGFLPRSRFSIVAVNFADYVLMAGITYMWLDYVMAVEQSPNRNRPLTRFAITFPFLLSTLTLIGVYCFAPQTLISDALVMQPVFYVFLIAVPCINIAAGIVYAMRKSRGEENPIEKQKHLYIGFFPLMVVGGGLVQILILPSTPIFCFCCTILMMVLYIQSMENQISMDPLTRLNNRGQLIRYISQKNSAFRKDRLTYVIMVDINSFKKINDTYGHAEGDQALIIIADSLKDVARRQSTPIFLSRYGGDEFVIIAQTDPEGNPGPLIREIRKQIEDRCAALNTPYLLSIGVGYDRLLDDRDTLQKCLQRADEKLYLDKANNRTPA